MCGVIIIAVHVANQRNAWAYDEDSYYRKLLGFDLGLTNF